MNMGKKIVLLLLCSWICLLITGGATVSAAANPYLVAGIENPTEFETAFAALQKAVAAGDRGQVADFILLPLRVNGWLDETQGKISRQFTSRQEVMDNYPEIFTPQVQAAIQKQKVDKLFVNWQGVMVGNGEAWLSVGVKTPVRYGIFAVNLGQ